MSLDMSIQNCLYVPPDTPTWCMRHEGPMTKVTTVTTVTTFIVAPGSPSSKICASLAVLQCSGLLVLRVGVFAVLNISNYGDSCVQGLCVLLVAHQGLCLCMLLCMPFVCYSEVLIPAIVSCYIVSNINTQNRAKQDSIWCYKWVLGWFFPP